MSINPSIVGPGEKPAALKRLLACGVVAPLFFIAMFLIEGATRQGYDPQRQPVSSLSIGESGWTQRANFIITGLGWIALLAMHVRRGPVIGLNRIEVS